MTSRRKRLLVVPVVVALYFVHPWLGFMGLAAGFVGVIVMHRSRDEMTSIAH